MNRCNWIISLCIICYTVYFWTNKSPRTW